LAFAFCRGWSNTTGIQHDASGAQCQEQDEIEALFPAGPESAQGNPKQLVERTKSWLGMPAFQDDELLAKSEVLQHQVLARTRKAKDGSEPDPDNVGHGDKVIPDEVLVRPPMLLISKLDGIVANDRPNEETYRAKIQPRLVRLTVSTISSALGIS
jgi:hypothetical protein